MNRVSDSSMNEPVLCSLGVARDRDSMSSEVERTDEERAWRAKWLSGHVVFLEGAVLCAG